MEYVGNTSFSDFATKITEGRGAVLLGMYEDLPETKRTTTSYAGPHALYINERAGLTDFIGYDPLYPYAITYSYADLTAFAEDYPGPGLVRAGFTKVTT